MAQPKQKPISKRPSRLISSLVAAKLAITPSTNRLQTPQSQNEIAARLAAERAQKVADQRRAQQPHDVENEENLPDLENESPENLSETTDQTQAPEEQPTEQEQQLNDEQQAEAAADMETNKQRQLAQLAQKEAKLEKELSELEGSLKDFRNGKVLKGLFLSGSRITFIIDRLIEEAKKPVKNLDDRAKAKKIQALILMMETLITMLRGLKLLAALVDGLFLHTLSTVRMIIFTLPTIILPIIIFLLFPVWVPILAVFFLIGKIPLLKGPLTQPVNELVDQLKKQKDAWKEELKKINKKINIREQLRKIKNVKNQIQVSQ